MTADEFEQIYLMDWAKLHKEISPYLLFLPSKGVVTAGNERADYSKGGKKGVSNVFLALPNKKYYGYWIHLKPAKIQPTPAELNWVHLMKETGYAADIILGWRLASNLIMDYMNNKL